MVNHERNCCSCVRSDGTWSRVIGQHGNSNGLVPFFGLFVNRFQHPLIEIFDGFYFERDVAFVAGFVARFDMEIHEIFLFQFLQGCLRFAFVVGIIKAGCSFHCNHFKSCINTYAANQIYRRNHRPASDRKHLAQRLHLRTISRRPRPNAVCGIFAFGNTFFVDRMIGQNLLRSEYQSVEGFGSGLRSLVCRFYQSRTKRLFGNVVRWCTINVFIAAFHL